MPLQPLQSLPVRDFPAAMRPPLLAMGTRMSEPASEPRQSYVDGDGDIAVPGEAAA
jgi:hypothetical protein